MTQRLSDSDLARIVGVEALQTLTEELGGGGHDWNVPTNTESISGRLLVQMIGERLAKKMIAECGGCRVYIPYDLDGNLTARYAGIHHLSRQGLSPREISKTFRYEGRYSEKHIREILSARTLEARPELKQPTLKQMDFFDMTEAA